MATSKTTLARKVYTYSDGETGRSAKPGWTKLTFELLAPEKDSDGNAIVLESVDVTPDMFPEDIQWCAIGHGLSQKLGDNLAGIAGKAAKDEDAPDFDEERGYVDYAVILLSDAIDNLKNGVWVSESEGSSGPGSVTMLYEAIVAAFTEAGSELSEEQLANIRTKLKDEDYRKAAKANPSVDAKYKELAAKRAAERAKAAKAKAKDAGADLGSLIG